MVSSETNVEEETAGQTAATGTESAVAISETAVETVVATPSETAVETVVVTPEEATVTTEVAQEPTVVTTTQESAQENTGACPVLGYDTTSVIIVVAVVVVVIALVALLTKKKTKGQKSVTGKPGKSTGADIVEIYVGNLSYDMTDAQLRREFERFGVVKSARVITHRTNGKSKGYGFVEMPHRREAVIGIKALDNSEVLGRRIRVNEARANTRPPER